MEALFQTIFSQTDV